MFLQSYLYSCVYLFHCCLLVNVLDTLSSLLFLSLTYHMIFFSSISKEGKVVVTRVSKLLLCIYSGSNVEFGMLKAKVLQFIHTTLTRKTTSPHPLMFSLPTVCITYTSSHSLFSLLFTGENFEILFRRSSVASTGINKAEQQGYASPHLIPFCLPVFSFCFHSLFLRVPACPVVLCVLAYPFIPLITSFPFCPVSLHHSCKYSKCS